MKLSTIAKAGCLAAIALPVYVVGVAAYDMTRTALKYPRMTLLAAATTGLLWYNCPAIKQEITHRPAYQQPAEQYHQQHYERITEAGTGSQGSLEGRLMQGERK